MSNLSHFNQFHPNQLENSNLLDLIRTSKIQNKKPVVPGMPEYPSVNPTKPLMPSQLMDQIAPFKNFQSTPSNPNIPLPQFPGGDEGNNELNNQDKIILRDLPAQNHLDSFRNM